MRLTKLELYGFKSFAKKTEMTFDAGITAVIGPNGSGKSNIADAVRWVLGEQSAKALRGTRMEDVIFSGTQERKAQAYCEVMLTFDNSDGTLPIDYNEVSVTRRVYRSGESEYAINKTNCRLKDVHELFRDTGIGKEGYSIIGQGKVEEILSNKSDDRRVALEEAAGIMRYRVRKEEAVRKLEHTQKNLERLEDILQELDAQRGPLEEQAEKACAYLSLRDELKDLEINVFLHQYERGQDRMETASKAVKQAEEEGRLLEDTEQALLSDCNAQEEALRAIEKNLADIQNRLLQELSAMEAHSGEAGVLRERKLNLEKERQRVMDARWAGVRKTEELRQSLQALENSDTDGKALLLQLDEKVRETEAIVAGFQKEIADQEETLEAQKNSIIEGLNRLSDAKSQLSRMEAMTGALLQRQEVVREEAGALGAAHTGLQNELQDARMQWDAQVTQYNRLLQAQADAQAQLALSRAAVADEEKALHDLEQQRSTMHARVNVLEEMARAHEGYYASVRNVLRDCDDDINLRRCILGVVAELIQVPAQYETAIEMSLGSALQNIVTPTPEHAKAVINHLRSKNYGRATLLPVSAMRPRLLSAQERAFLSMPGCLGVASELVACERQYQNVLDNLLGRTVIVETLDEGIAINKQARAAFRIATLKGDIIHPGGSMTGGSIQKREFSLLGRDRERKQLAKGMEQMQARIQAQQGCIALAQKRAQERQLFMEQAEEAVHAKDIDNARNKEKLELIQRDIHQSEQKLAQNALELGQIQDNLADIEKERQAIEALESGIQQGSAATKEDVAQSQAKLAFLREQSQSAVQALTDYKVQHMARQKEEDAMAQEKKRLERELAQLTQQIDEADKQQEKNLQQEEALEATVLQLQSGIQGEQMQVDIHKEQQQALEEERQKRMAALSESRARRDDMHMRIRELEEKKHKQALAFSRAELEVASMQERIMQEYALGYEQALAYRRQPFGVTAAHVRIDELKSAIRELGNINVNAVEDSQILSERCDSLHAQCEDLYKAKEDLQLLITELTTTMETQFVAQFEIVQTHFTRIFGQLFDGGYAEIRLANAKDPLNCEIDIIAQPPGKKLQLLTLLSGGERALTAIALLFALLRLKPTVFCILDEIETSLDEVNVARFANYLKRYAADTQFILITHRKGSMEVCNALYGVAMEEKGVSRLVSARFGNTAS